MSEKMTDGMTEAQRRAEKIKAIRRSIHGEAEVAPTTYEKKADNEKTETMADRIMRAKEKKRVTAADILDELDEAIAYGKAEAARLEAEAAAAAAEKADHDISDLISSLETTAHEETENTQYHCVPPLSFSHSQQAPVQEETDSGADVIAGDNEDEAPAADEETDNYVREEAFAGHVYEEVPETEEPAADPAEDTVVFTPVSRTAETAPEPAKEELGRPAAVAAPERAAEEVHEPAAIKAPEGKSFAEAVMPDNTEQAKPKKKKKKKKTVAQRLRGLLPEKGDSVGECIRKVVFLGSICAICICGYLVGDYYYELWASRHKTEQIMELYDIYEDREAPTEAVEEEGETRIRYMGMLDGARKLWDQNHDIVGVITIPDTPINNPVMQAEDNDKYINRKFDLSENRAGELFLDFRNHFDDVDEEGYLRFPNSDNLVIYGHNMLDEQMFGSLKWYQRHEDYYGKHPIIQLSSNYEKYTYKIFAFFVLDASDETETKFDCWNELDFAGEDDFYRFVNEAKKRTFRLNDVDVKYGDPLLTLSTCNTTLPDEDRGRLIIMARRVRDGEDPMAGTQNSRPNPNIKRPTIYYQDHPNEKYDPDAEFVPYG